MSKSYEKKSVALAQLETALKLFQEDDLFSAGTLAGAAEEILGGLVRAKGDDNSLDSLKKAAVAIHHHLHGQSIPPKAFANRANLFRNWLKHLNAPGPPAITFDLREEVVDLLNRAVDNHWTLEKSLSPAMEEFSKAQRS